MSIIDRKITAFSKKISDRPMRERNQGTNIKLYIETPSYELKDALNGVIDDITNEYASISESKLDKTGNFTGTWGGESKSSIDSKISTANSNGLNAMAKATAIESQLPLYTTKEEIANSRKLSDTGNFTGTWGGESKSSIDNKIATATTNSQSALTQVTALTNTVNQFDDRISTAESNSQSAVMKTTVLEGQFNQLIINEGNSNAEIVASRVKEDGTEFDSLPERLNAADSAFDSLLSETKNYEGKKYQINNPYRFGGSLALKGQMHCHTTNSDGVDTPSALVTAYKNAGYNFIAITDHDYITPNPVIPEMTFIQGIEELIGNYHAHITAYDIVEQSTSKVNSEVVEFHSKNGSLVGFAHPKLGTVSVSDSDIMTIKGYNFLEVFNSFESVNRENVYDMALSSGKRVFCLAVDDCHDTTGAMFNKGWVVVFTDVNDKNHIVESLRNGNFYSSTGNDLSVNVEGNIISVSSTSPSNFKFVGLNGKILQSNSGATTAIYTIKGDEGYIRITSQKLSDSTMAWSNAIFIDTIDTDKVEIDINKNSHNYGNRIINGNFDIWQRGNSFEKQFGYTADRWQISTDASLARVTRQFMPSENGINACRLELITKGDSYSDCALMQVLETINSYYYQGKTITFSALMRRNATFNAGSFGLDIYSGTGIDEYNVATGRIVDASTFPYSDLDTAEWRRIKITATIQWDRTQLGFLIRFKGKDIPDGSYIEFREVQVNIGDSVLPYKHKTFNEELTDCLRYYEKSYEYEITPGTNGHIINYSLMSGIDNTTILNFNPYNFKVQKRKSPNVKIYSLLGTENAVSMSGSDVVITSPIINSGKNGITYITAGSGTPFVSGTKYSCHWTADAEIWLL